MAYLIRAPLVLALTSLASCHPAAASDLDLRARLATARDGQTVRVPAGKYGVLTLSQREFPQGLIVDASAAQLDGVVLTHVSGVTLRGGSIVGSGGKSYGVKIDHGRNITIDGLAITGAHRGIVVNESSGIVLVRNQLIALISDGIDIALSRRVQVLKNTCRDFRPILATYDSSGNRIEDGDHPDCIQAWSRPTAPPTADLLIADNIIEGVMQGIFLGNHVRNGIDDGGFDRVVVRGNRVHVGMPNGIGLYGVRDAQVTNNTVTTFPNRGSPKPPHRPYRAQLQVKGERVLICGNSVDGGRNEGGPAC